MYGRKITNNNAISVTCRPAFNFKTEKQLLEDAVCEEAIKQSGSPVLSWGRPEAENFRARKPRGRRHYSRPNFNGRTSSRSVIFITITCFFKKKLVEFYLIIIFNNDIILAENFMVQK